MTGFLVPSASFTIHFYMGSIRPVAIAIAICLALTYGTALGSAQSSPQSRDSAKISSATAPDDQAFAGYERVTAGHHTAQSDALSRSGVSRSSA